MLLKKAKKSLIVRLTFTTLCIFIPLTSLLIFSNFYAINILRDKVTESNQNTISYYMNQLDASLNDINNYLIGLNNGSLDIVNFQNGTESSRYFSKINLLNSFKAEVYQSKLMDGAFIFSKSNDDIMYFDNTQSDYNQKSAILNYITHNEDFNRNGLRWFPVRINGHYYLMRAFVYENTYWGAWIDINVLIHSLRNAYLQQTGTMLFATSDGEPMLEQDLIQKNKIDLTGNLRTYYHSGINNKYLIIGKESSCGNFRLLSVAPEQNILQGLSLIQIITLFIALLSVILVPLSLMTLRKWIFNPIIQLKEAIKEVESGNLDYQIGRYSDFIEFSTLDNAFDSMTRQIKNLKITVYEEKLQKQKSQIEFMQLQIKPHFYLNAFNTIYSMAMMKEDNLIKEMVLYLSNYLRYMCRSNTFVLLSDELMFIKDYLEIQKLRSGLNLVCNINIDQNIMGCMIPPLVIQTFVENSLKYGLNPSGKTIISISVFSLKNNSGDFIKIVIKDNGNGFTDQMLDSHANQSSDKKKKIGIYNVKQRLELLYEGKASLSLKNNSDSGACVEITLPLKKGEKDHESFDR